MAAESVIGIRIGVEGASKTESDLRRVQGGINDLGGAASAVGSQLRGFAGAFAGVISVGAFVKAADAVTILQNQLKLATGSATAAATAYEGLFEIAQRSRTSFTELGGTFASISRAGEQLGLTQRQLLGVTEAIGNAIAIGGQSAASSQAALTQLSQGLASGVLRGEELNSIMEQTPRLARALADGLGVPIGKLRELGQAGELTAEKVIGALTKQQAVLASEVQNSTVTVGQAFTVLQNQATVSVGELDKATGASAALAAGLTGVASAIKTIGEVASENSVAVQGVIGVIAGAATLAAIGRAITAVKGLAGAWALLNTAILANPIGLAIAGTVALGAGAAFALKEFQKTESGIKDSIKGAQQQIEASEAALERARARGATAAVKEIEGRIDAAKTKIANLRAELGGKLAEGAEQYDEPRFKRAVVESQDRDAKAVQAAIKAKTAAEAATKAAATGTKRVNEFAKSVERGTKLYGDLIAKDAGLAPDFAEKWQDLANAYSKGAINVEQLTAAQAALLAQQPVIKDGLEAQAKSLEELAEAEKKWRDQSIDENAATLEAMQARTAAMEADVIKQREANEEIGLSAQALGELQAARLEDAAAEKERLAAVIEGAKPQLADEYRAQAKALRELAKARTEGATKQTAADAAKELEVEGKKATESIERSLTDALMRGFESGKGFGKNLADTIKNQFNTMVLRPTLSAIVSPIAGAFGGTANAGQSPLSGIKDVASSVSNFFQTGGKILGSMAATTSAYAAAVPGLTSTVAGSQAAMLAAQTGSFGTAGLSATAAAGGGSALGSVAAAAPYIAAAIAVAALLSKKTPGEQAMGGFASSRGLEATQANAQALTGDAGMARDLIVRRNEGLESVAKSAVDSVLTATEQRAKALGLNIALGIDAGFAANLNGKGANKNAFGYAAIFANGEQVGSINNRELGEDVPKAIEKFTAQMYEAAAAAVLAGTDFGKTGETAGQTLERLSTNLTAVNAVFDTLGTSLMSVSLGGADAASRLVEAFGGIQAFQQSTSFFYENFYTDAERLATTTRQLQDAFGEYGAVVPETREQFRGLAQSLKEAGDFETLAKLLSVAPAFAQVASAAEQTAAASEQAAQTISSAMRSLLDEGRGLERELLQLTGGDVRGFDTQGLSAEEVAQYDRNAQLRAQIEAERARQSAAQEAEAMQRQAAEEAARLQQEQYEAQRQAAEEAARAIRDAQRSAISEQIAGIEQVAQKWRGLVDTLGGSIADLRGQAAGGMAFDEARRAIDVAAMTGAIDPDRISDAVRVAVQGVGSGLFASQFEENAARLTLANQLETIQGQASIRLGGADAQIAALNQQLAALDSGNVTSAEALALAVETRAEVTEPSFEVQRRTLATIQDQNSVAADTQFVMSGILDEQRLLRAEIAALRAENTQLQRQTAAATARSADVLERYEAQVLDAA